MSQTDDRNYIELSRREKRAALEALGVAPFAYSFARTHTAEEALRQYDPAMGDAGPRVMISGRVASLRSQGKTAFLHVEDGSGRIQVYLRRDQPGLRWDVIDLVDLDDHVGIEGTLFRTRTGETTVRAESLTMLSKSLRPLPRGKVQQTADGAKVFGGLEDPEVRYRQRYVDLAVHPSVRDVFRVRAQAISWIRRFLDERGFLEVETPILQPLYGGASARPFVTYHNTLNMPLFLRIADELYLKRLVVGGLERVYEIGHDFRNEGMDRTHNPEFTMLEWYMAYADYHTMLEMFEEMLSGLVRHLLGSTILEREGHALDFTPPYRRVQFVSGIVAAGGPDVLTASEDEMRRSLRARGLSEEAVAALSGGRLVDEVFKTYLEPSLQQPTFLMDYPLVLSPLARLHWDDPRLTERFEFFVQGKEIANAFSELSDPDDQRARFEDQARQRAAGDDEAQQFDHDYVRALEYGLPPTGGIGVGIDRLVMLLTGQSSIRDVILFPAMRPEHATPPSVPNAPVEPR